MSRTGSLLNARLALLVLLAVFAGGASLRAEAGTTQSFTLAAGTYAGSRDRNYKVYTPTGLPTPAPMVMALHGCEQTNDDVLNDWGLTAAADRFHFVLVAPFITSYDGVRNTNCWGFWLDQHRHQGRGEVEDLHRIALEVEGRFAIDPARRYITGLSSGGAMTVVAAVAYNEYWAAAASAAGLPYGEDAASVSLSQQCPGMGMVFHTVTRVAADMRAELNDPYAIPLMVLQSEKDCVVVLRAGENIRDAHLQVFGDSAHNTPSTAETGEEACASLFQSNVTCQHTFYSADGGTRSLVETVFYLGPVSTPNPGDKDVGHYWVGGEQGRDGHYAMRQGPSYPDIIWDFFLRHARGAVPAGHPAITLNGANPMRLTVGQTFVDPGATATDPEDGNIPVVADCRDVDTSREGTYICSYTATDHDGNSTKMTRGVIVSASKPPACVKANASPLAHINANRATRGGPFNLRALATGNGADIGFGWDSWSQVTLYEGTPGKWFPDPPSGCPG